MRRLILVLLAVLLAFSAGVDAKVGYPQQCCDNATDPTSCEWLTCDELRSGSSSSLPTYVDLYRVGGVSVNVNGGNRDGGTQTVTLADDDPAVTSLGVMDDWDATEGEAASSDGATIMVEAKSSQKSAVDDGDAARPVANLNGELVIAGYSWTTNSNRSEEQDPISSHHNENTLCDLTNIATNTTDYCGYIDMDDYRSLGIQIETSGTAPTDVLTVTFECSIQDDNTAPASCTYQDITNDLFGVASVVDSNDFWIVSTPLPVKYCRVKYVTSNDGGNDADLTVFYKVLY